MTMKTLGFPGGSDGKESAFNAGDPASIPGSRRAWQPTPVFLPGEFHGRGSLVGYSPWGPKESDTTERLQFSLSPQSLQVECSPADTWILAWRNPLWISSLRTCKMVGFCCFTSCTHGSWLEQQGKLIRWVRGLG